jgi:hypothetical protein
VGIEPTNDGLKPSAITILAIRSIAVGAFYFGNASILHCRSMSGFGYKAGRSKLTALLSMHFTRRHCFTKHKGAFTLLPSGARPDAPK